MSLIEPTILLAPSLTAASRPEQSGIVIADHDALFTRPFDRQSPLNGQRAQSLALE
jgi:hypothetical protein